jgi:hypothetical protein
MKEQILKLIEGYEKERDALQRSHDQGIFLGKKEMLGKLKIYSKVISDLYKLIIKL